MTDIETLIREWDGLATVVRFDHLTGTWIFIAIHDDTLGRPVGGTRMKVYPHPADGLRDAHRLAEGMTYKWAAAGIDTGGAKAVLAIPRPLQRPEREGLLRRYGRLLASLRGSFGTGQDLGTTPEDMAIIARETRYVHGVSGGVATDPGPYTARGVFAAIRATVRQLSGSDDLTGRAVLVQGVGGVGAPLARRLAAAGAEVLLSDVDEAKAEALAREVGGRAVPPSEAVATPCDVFAPCAVGAVLNPETIPRLACRAVCGSANNQLECAEDADLLHARGILYAPDYVANSGGAISFGLTAEGVDQEEIARRLDGIADVVGEIFAEAEQEGRSPLWAARRRAERKLQGEREKEVAS